jgi:N6-L-threonylcarbamoyladenine synthase
VCADSAAEPSFPSIALIVSGGHTSLVWVERQYRPGAHIPLFSYTRLGQTRDDAAGEAFDKVAKLLALGYPGGPVIDELARYGDPQAVEFGAVKMRGNPLDFSFSGLKTAVLYRLRGTPLAAEAEERRAWRKTAGRLAIEEIRVHCSQQTLDLVASFQNAVVDDLVERTFLAAKQNALRTSARGVTSVLVSGGVACNSLLRARFQEAGSRSGLNVFLPSPKLSTDNAAMIAAAGFFKLTAGQRADDSLTAHASLPLGFCERC